MAHGKILRGARNARCVAHVSANKHPRRLSPFRVSLFLVAVQPHEEQAGAAAKR